MAPASNQARRAAVAKSETRRGRSFAKASSDCQFNNQLCRCVSGGSTSDLFRGVRPVPAPSFGRFERGRGAVRSGLDF